MIPYRTYLPDPDFYDPVDPDPGKQKFRKRPKGNKGKKFS
jgi:hypothetical protein